MVCGRSRVGHTLQTRLYLLAFLRRNPVDVCAHALVNAPRLVAAPRQTVQAGERDRCRGNAARLGQLYHVVRTIRTGTEVHPVELPPARLQRHRHRIDAEQDLALHDGHVLVSLRSPRRERASDWPPKCGFSQDSTQRRSKGRHHLQHKLCDVDIGAIATEQGCFITFTIKAQQL